MLAGWLQAEDQKHLCRLFFFLSNNNFIQPLKKIVAEVYTSHDVYNWGSLQSRKKKLQASIKS